MTKSEKRKLLRAFEVAYEMAYRRGFQHGFVAKKQAPPGVVLTDRQVHDWRFSPVGTTTKAPPGSGGYQGKILDRILMESRDDVIREFVRRIDLAEANP